MARPEQLTDAAPRSATIRDVARLSGVSPSTASKTLNHHAGIAAATRARVMDAARQLGYGPTQMARGTFARRSFIVGLITSDSFGRFSGPIMAGAEAALGSGHVAVIMADSNGDATQERHHLAVLKERRVDGLIVTGRCSNLRPSLGRDLPFPVVYAHTPSDDPDDVSIMVDDEQAGRLAGEHLAGLGRTRIAEVTGPWDFDAVGLRSEGFRQALASHGLTPTGRTTSGFWCEPWGREAIASLLAETPDMDAVYCHSDLLARGVLDGLRQAGRRVPEDVAVVGTDNWQLMALAARPRLTTVDMNLTEVGRRAATVLLEAIGTPASGRQEMVEPTLVARESTGTLTDDPPWFEPGHYHKSCIHVP